MNETEKKIKELRNTIEYHNKKYYIDNEPEISDFEFDRMLAQLTELENQYPQLITPDSPTQRVGGAPLTEFKTIKHKIPLKSLENTYSEKDIINWYNKLLKL